MIRKKYGGKLPYFNILLGIWIFGMQLQNLILKISLQEQLLR